MRLLFLPVVGFSCLASVYGSMHAMEFAEAKTALFTTRIAQPRILALE